MKIVLVHGGGHGAWCWYKVLASLRSQGHSATAVDLAACGSDSRKMGEDVSSFDEYTRPLMDFMASLPDGEKVVLVGHSFGGFSLASAMDVFPQKIVVAVFVTAVLPDTAHGPWHIFQQLFDRFPEIYDMFKKNMTFVPGKVKSFSVTTPNSELLKTHYQNCSFEDLTLANMLVRPGSFFEEDLSKKSAFSEERYGFVDKAFIVCKEDVMFTEDFQRWMIENNPVKEVMEIEKAGHMAMLSKPLELCHCITTIVNKYAH